MESREPTAQGACVSDSAEPDENAPMMSQEEYIASIIDPYRDTFESEAEMEALKLELLKGSLEESTQHASQMLDTSLPVAKAAFSPVSRGQSSKHDQEDHGSDSESDNYGASDQPDTDEACHALVSLLKPSIQNNRQSYYIIQRTWASDPIYIPIAEEEQRTEAESTPAGDTADADRQGPVLFSKAHLVYQSARPRRECLPGTAEDPCEKPSTARIDYPHLFGDLLPFIFPLFDQKPGASSPAALFYAHAKMNEMIMELRCDGLSSLEYRALAAEASRERAQVFGKASAAYQRGRQAKGRAIAGYYAEEGRKWTHRMLFYHQRAALHVLLKNHPKGTTDTLDLHGLLVHESTKLLFPAMEAWYAFQSGLGFPSAIDNENYRHSFGPEPRTMEQFWNSWQLEIETDVEQAQARAWDKEASMASTGALLPAQTAIPIKGRKPTTVLTLITGAGHHSAKSARLKPELVNLLRNNGQWDFDARAGSIVVHGRK